jgi:hypothetical protein
LSPNFALGHYTLAFVHSQAGDPHAAIAASDHSRRLSPFDPLLFGMLGARAMALVRLGRFEEAAEWGVEGRSSPQRARANPSNRRLRVGARGPARHGPRLPSRHTPDATALRCR